MYLDPRQLISNIRDNPEGLARIRLGRGVVGNTTYAWIILCPTVVGLVWALNATPWFAVGLVGAILLVFLIFLLGTYMFANKHPALAALGDTEYLQLQEAQMAAKNLPKIPEGPIIEAPPVPDANDGV